MKSDPWFDEAERMWFRIVVRNEKPLLFMGAKQNDTDWVMVESSLMNPWEIAARAIFSLQSEVNFEVSLDTADEELRNEISVP